MKKSLLIFVFSLLLMGLSIAQTGKPLKKIKMERGYTKPEYILIDAIGLSDSLGKDDLKVELYRTGIFYKEITNFTLAINNGIVWHVSQDDIPSAPDYMLKISEKKNPSKYVLTYYFYYKKNRVSIGAKIGIAAGAIGVITFVGLFSLFFMMMATL